MNQKNNYMTSKKAKYYMIRRIVALALAGTIGFVVYKKMKNEFINEHKYNTTYKKYSTLTDDTTLVKENEKGNEEEIIMKVYHEDKDNTGTRIIDTYYLEKNEAYELMDYLNLKSEAISRDTITEEYHGSNEEYTEISMVNNIDIDEKAVEPIGTEYAIEGAILSLGCCYFCIAMYNVFTTPISKAPMTLAGRIKLYNELKKEEEPKKKIKKL